MPSTEIKLQGGRVVLRVSRGNSRGKAALGGVVLTNAFAVRQELLASANDPSVIVALRSWCSTYLHDHVYKPVEHIIDELGTAVETDALSIIKYTARTAGHLADEGANEAAQVGGWTPMRDNTPIDFRDDSGREIFSWEGKAMKKPTLPLASFFIDQGLTVKGDNFVDPLYDVRLPLFFQGGAWDMQRFKGAYLPEFIDFATVAIGLFGAAANTSQTDILEWQDLYASINSKFPNAIPDNTYTHLARRNVFNTKLGYALYSSGAIKGTR